MLLIIFPVDQMLTARRKRKWYFETIVTFLGLICIAGSLLHLVRLRSAPPASESCPLGPGDELLLKACLFGHIRDPKWLKAALSCAEIALVGLGLSYVFTRHGESMQSKRQGVLFFSGLGALTIAYDLVRLSHGTAVFVVFCFLVFLSLVLAFLAIFLHDSSQPKLVLLRLILTAGLWSIQLFLLVSIAANSATAGIAMLSAGTAVSIISFIALRHLSHPPESPGQFEDAEVLIKKSSIIDSIA